VQTKKYGLFTASSLALPQTAAGAELMKDALDDWGTPLQYRMINRNLFKLTSLGADKTFMTPDDVILEVAISRPGVAKDKTESPHTWREARLIALLGDEGQKIVNRERGGVDSIEYRGTVQVGGQSTLEGADYFWFWTWTMLVTAFLFVFVAVWYTPKTYLQEEVKVDF
jgi:POT family proton-dependent oligopeptide transporter